MNECVRVRERERERIIILKRVLFINMCFFSRSLESIIYAYKVGFGISLALALVIISAIVILTSVTCTCLHLGHPQALNGICLI